MKTECPRRAKGKKVGIRVVVSGTMILLLVGFGLQFNVQGTGRDVAEQLKLNVVQLTVKSGDTILSHGFGFVVGEEDAKLYAVTAKHVVISDDPSFQVTDICAQFQHRKGKDVTATLLKTSDEVDLALLEIPKPVDYTWLPEFFLSELAQHTPVWFIGRSEEWFIPSQSGSFLNYDLLKAHLDLEIYSLQLGSSGAPLVSEDGIVGMITEDSVGRSRGLSIVVIRAAVEDLWEYPWGTGSHEDLYEVGIGWSGSGQDRCSFWVVVANNSSEDVYVKSVQLEKQSPGVVCGLVPDVPELVPPHPYVRASDSLQILYVEAEATQQEVVLCGIRANVTIVEGTQETSENTVVVRSETLGDYWIPGTQEVSWPCQAVVGAVDRDTNAPIEGAVATILQNGTVIAKAKTWKDGWTDPVGLPTCGTYRLVITHPDYKQIIDDNLDLSTATQYLMYHN